MRSRRVSDVAELLDPEADRWSRPSSERVKLLPTPLGLQPNAYLRAAWSERSYGRVGSLRASSAHDGQRLVLLLSWKSPRPTERRGEGFGDGVAVALPVRGDPMLASMGAPEAPIHLLHWLAGIDGARSLVATGIGSTQPGPDVGAGASAVWKEGIWRVVLVRALAGPDGAASLAAGGESRLGFAVWSGANQERAGIKAFSVDWRSLVLDP